jgi:hypothetical protein
MEILGSILKKGIKLSAITEKERASAKEQQLKELRKLLATAKSTAFGTKFQFGNILKQGKDVDAIYKTYKTNVPIYNYNTIFEEWWQQSKDGKADVCWPGKIKYFALSSGTSEASSKHIPITNEILNANKKTGIKQIKSLSKYNLPDKLFTKGILMLGGSTELNKSGHYFEGDLSGIQVSKIPLWFQSFYKPGKAIAKNKDWTSKLREITLQASKWDIGYLVGVPAWIQLMMEEIIAHYKINTIHDIWPNLEVFTHGGVSFDPYRKSFEKLLGKPLTYIETYLASEGFIAYQSAPDSLGMKMVLNNGIFFEFVPFNEANFDDYGDLVDNPEVLMIHQVEAHKPYALLLSTCAGAWRYLIGDVVKFVDLSKSEIVICGRTKHFLSLCGEHLSVDNMNKAIKLTSEKLGISIKEFGVSGINHDTMFAHKWYVGVAGGVDAQSIKENLDECLKELNDDYRTERISALKEIFVEVLPVETFYAFMKSKGKEGGQNKFPRVLKNKQLADWELFLKENDMSKTI